MAPLAVLPPVPARQVPLLENVLRGSGCFPCTLLAMLLVEGTLEVIANTAQQISNIFIAFLCR